MVKKLSNKMNNVVKIARENHLFNSLSIYLGSVIDNDTILLNSDCQKNNTGSKMKKILQSVVGKCSNEALMEAIRDFGDDSGRQNTMNKYNPKNIFKNNDISVASHFKFLTTIHVIYIIDRLKSFNESVVAGDISYNDDLFQLNLEYISNGESALIKVIIEFMNIDFINDFVSPLIDLTKLITLSRVSLCSRSRIISITQNFEETKQEVASILEDFEVYGFAGACVDLTTGISLEETKKCYLDIIEKGE